MNTYFVYILTNWDHHVMYVGMTNHLARRLMENRQGMLPGFTRRYHVHKLVFYESPTDVRAAIA